MEQTTNDLLREILKVLKGEFVNSQIFDGGISELKPKGIGELVAEKMVETEGSQVLIYSPDRIRYYSFGGGKLPQQSADFVRWAIAESINKSVADEREACAKSIEEMVLPMEWSKVREFVAGMLRKRAQG